MISTTAEASVPYQQVQFVPAPTSATLLAPEAKVWPDKHQHVVRLDHGTYVHWKVDEACGDVHAISDPWNQRWFLINFRDHPKGSHLFYFHKVGDYLFGLESDSGCTDSTTIHVVKKRR